MKNCPVCNAPLNDESVFCTQCGAPQQAQQASAAEQAAPVYTAPQSNPGYAAPVYAIDPYDHTAEMDPKDISKNKVIAMCIYLMSWIGILIALLASKESEYVAFHVRQALKIEVTNILLGLAAVLLCWTILVPIAAGVCVIILFVLRIIAFFQICGGKAKEVAIIRGLGFLK